jgi:hypothetical protein
MSLSNAISSISHVIQCHLAVDVYVALLVILVSLSGAGASETSLRHLFQESAACVDPSERASCGNNDETELEICHCSNDGDFQTLCVTESGATGHMKNHGNDHCGPCTSEFSPIAFDFYEQVFGEPSLDENGDPAFPLFDVQGWTSPSQTEAHTAQTLDGQSVIVQVIESVVEWNDILDDIVKSEDLTPSDLNDLTGDGYEATPQSTS